MAAYVLIDRLSVTDQERFGGYSEQAQVAVEFYGGRHVLPPRVEIHALEGNWKPNRILVIEFADVHQARRWWNSPEYAGARAIHRQTTISNIILVESVSP